MLFKEFDEYNKKCPVCKESLVLIANVDFIIENTERIALMGGIVPYIYDYKKSRFFKTSDSSYFLEGSNPFIRSEFDKLINKFTINSFSVNNKIFPKINRSKLENALTNFRINEAGCLYGKQCINSNHYTYTSGGLYKVMQPYAFTGFFGNEFDLYINEEKIRIYDYIITNYFFDNKPKSTEIKSKINILSKVLPQISLNKWNFSSKDCLKNQIDNRMVLL